jgi:penicillin-binding protein 2
MRLDHPLSRRSRARGGTVVIVLLMGLLILAFFRAQVLRSHNWELQADGNRLRPLPVPAPRGTIFDRNDSILADNVPGWEVVLLPDQLDTIRSRLQGLQPFLGLTEDRVQRLMQTAAAYPRQPLMVKVNAPFDEVSSLEERKGEFPGLVLQMRPRRRYVLGGAFAHALGYLGEITSEELEDPRYAQDAEDRYGPGSIVGKDGLERQYEDLLQGVPGYRYVEVDVLGRIVGSFAGPADSVPSSGEDIHLNIDAPLQAWVHRIFPDTMRGAVVALNVEDGGILALYSSPTFDPNDFVGGIRSELWDDLMSDPARPLFNRATLGIYPPGSTWKLATAAIALNLGVVRPDEFMPIPCTGGMAYGNGYFRCWNPEGHGPQDLLGAIRHSCNVYFYQLGLRIGLQRLLEEGTRIGFNQRCGVDLPAETQGLFPDDTTYWERAPQFGYKATEGEVFSLAIGQGPNAQTPLKMAQFYLAIARDGSAPPPRLRKTEDPPEGGWSLDLSREALETMREGLRGVVRPGGTAYLSSLEHWDLMGKTGTVQNPPNPDHAWFAGIAGPRGGEPEIVVVVIVEFGQSGSGVAAPLVAKTADYFLRRKYGIPVDSIQTLREHLLTGRPAPWAAALAAGGDGVP